MSWKQSVTQPLGSAWRIPGALSLLVGAWAAFAAALLQILTDSPSPAEVLRSLVFLTAAFFLVLAAAAVGLGRLNDPSLRRYFWGLAYLLGLGIALVILTSL